MYEKGHSQVLYQVKSPISVNVPQLTIPYSIRVRKTSNNDSIQDPGAELVVIEWLWERLRTISKERKNQGRPGSNASTHKALHLTSHHFEQWIQSGFDRDSGTFLFCWMLHQGR